MNHDSPNSHAARQAPARAAAGGFTLVEMLASLVILSVLTAAIGSAIVVASRAIPDGHAAPSQMIAAGKGADLLARELYYAQSVTSLTPTSVTFTVAPRGTDTFQETITYSWSGKAHDPLLRQYNGNAPAPVALDVEDFNLTYNRRTDTSTKTVTTLSTTPEAQLVSLTGWPGLTLTLNDFGPTSTNWVSEYVSSASLAPPTGATAMTITRVKLMMKSLGIGTPTFTVGIFKPASAGSPTPSSTAIGTPVNMAAGLLSVLYLWTDVPFTDVTTTNLAQDFNIVIKGPSGLAPLSVQYMSNASAPADLFKMQSSTNSGTAWSPLGTSTQINQQDVPFQVYGTWTVTSSATTTTTNYYLTSVGIRLRCGDDASAKVCTASEIYTQPQVTGP